MKIKKCHRLACCHMSFWRQALSFFSTWKMSICLANHQNRLWQLVASESMSSISPLSMVELDCTLHAKRFHPRLVTGSDTGCCIAFLSRQCCSFRCWLLLWQIAFFAFGLFQSQSCEVRYRWIPRTSTKRNCCVRLWTDSDCCWLAFWLSTHPLRCWPILLWQDRQLCDTSRHPILIFLWGAIFPNTTCLLCGYSESNVNP